MRSGKWLTVVIWTMLIGAVNLGVWAMFDAGYHDRQRRDQEIVRLAENEAEVKACLDRGGDPRYAVDERGRVYQFFGCIEP